MRNAEFVCATRKQTYRKVTEWETTKSHFYRNQVKIYFRNNLEVMET